MQTKDLKEPFRLEVFKKLKVDVKVNDVVIESIANWHHSGFNVYCSKAIWSHNEDGLEIVAVSS